MARSSVSTYLSTSTCLGLTSQRYCSTSLVCRQESPGPNQFAFINPAWEIVKDKVDGYCLHAYTGETSNTTLAANQVVSQVRETMPYLNLQVPVIVSECSVNRAAHAQYKADVYKQIDAALAQIEGVEACYYFVSHWDGMPEHQENWHGTTLPEHYKAS